MSCEVCQEQQSKYKCPRCCIKTCSLQCVKQHKRSKECSGVRNKTAYVPIKQFTESHLLSDYRFLEDVDRKAYTAHKDDNLKLPARSNDGYLPKKLHQLKRAAKQRGVNLKLLPATFSRHKNNTTGFKQIGERRSVLHWRVEWIFPQSNDVTYVNDSLAENCVLRSALEDYIHQTKGNPVYTQRLKHYCSEGIDTVRLFMNIGCLPGGKARYKELKLDQSLAGNLAHTCIIEYPTIIVVLKQHADQYVHSKPESKTNPKKAGDIAATIPTEGTISVPLPTLEHNSALPSINVEGNSSPTEGGSTGGLTEQSLEGSIHVAHATTEGSPTPFTDGKIEHSTEGSTQFINKDNVPMPHTEASVNI